MLLMRFLTQLPAITVQQTSLSIKLVHSSNDATSSVNHPGSASATNASDPEGPEDRGNTTGAIDSCCTGFSNVPWSLHQSQLTLDWFETTAISERSTARPPPWTWLAHASRRTNEWNNRLSSKSGQKHRRQL